jgi:hypothetical protein
MIKLPVALVLACGWAGAQLAAQTAPASVRVSVVNSSDAPVTDLKAADFMVSIGGRVVPHKLAGGARPSTFVVLIDNSSSNSLSDRHMRRLVLDGFVQSLDEADHAFLDPIISTAGLGYAPVGKTSMRDAAAVLVKVLTSATEPSPLWDALVRTSRWIRTRPAEPSAILLITDGRATGNHCGVNDAVAAMLAVQTSVSVLSAAAPIEVMREGTSTVEVDPGRILRQVADTTGGQYLEGAHARVPVLGDRSRFDAEIDRDRDAVRKWVQLSRAQYSLQLDLPPELAGGQVEVRVRRPGVSVRASRVATVAEPSPACLPEKVPKAPPYVARLLR